MGSPSREHHDRRHAKDGEVGSDGTHYKGDYEHDRRAEQHRCDWTEGPYYDGQLAEDGIHGKGIYE